RAQGTVFVSRVDFGGQENFFAPWLGKFAEPLFAESFDRSARVRSGRVKIVDAEVESFFQESLRGFFAFNGAEARAGAEADAGNHLAGFSQAALCERCRHGAQSFFGGAKHDRSGGALQKITAGKTCFHISSLPDYLGLGTS